ncbi:NlpC/P60 family protein [Rhodococcus sp. X156]|uniref:NlpC/P60 family protein n=1 Tax=Rhodococcus sp. X156 TaxID=2499145 RepID=UPI001F49BB54|nr:NlpC/P60 family protein [Rhodococcus sp. X156]
MPWLHSGRIDAPRRRAPQAVLALLASLLVLVGVASPAAAQPDPTPPPNPGDGQLNEAAEAAQRKADELTRLAGQLTSAQTQLVELHNQLALTMETANKALVDHTAAQQAATSAATAATVSGLSVLLAKASLDDANARAARFALGSFQQGSTISSFSAYMAANSPDELLDRVALLNAVGGSQLEVMKGLDAARQSTADADARAVASKAQADTAAADAGRAKQTADAAMQQASKAQASQLARAKQLESQAARAQYDLQVAADTANGLQRQRASFEQWDAQRRAQQAAADRQAAEQARQAIASINGSLESVPATPAAQAVIRRAATQLGQPYSWGGGSYTGPTVGIRDGGVADTFGDYAKVGFDCSGLMMYAFAAVGIQLPHYSGYQYQSGRQVPLAEMQPGDMVFYGPSGIHHVALYIGAGKMIEAPESGKFVTVSNVRTDGLVPYAVRMT